MPAQLELVTVPKDLFDVLFHFAPGRHEFPPAFQTAKLEIRTDPQDKKTAFPAGVRFLHLEDVIQLYVHNGQAPFSEKQE